jgi:hypothetical protein
MSAVGAVADRTERPAYVRFERRPIENKAATLEQGKWVGRDVDFALITPPYSKDVHVVKCDQWLANLEADLRNERIPLAWAENYRKQYHAWKNGQELPLNGTPIKGWGVISPAQQQTLTSINILTVEDLAGINDEGVRRIGMGAIELKNKAKAWLAQLSDKGPLTLENAALKTENANLRAQVDALTKQVQALAAGRAVESTSTETLTADDILPNETPTPTIKRK